MPSAIAPNESLDHDLNSGTVLAQQGHDKHAKAFTKALDVQHPYERRKAAANALHAMQDGIALAWGQTLHGSRPRRPRSVGAFSQDKEEAGLLIQ